MQNTSLGTLEYKCFHMQPLEESALVHVLVVCGLVCGILNIPCGDISDLYALISLIYWARPSGMTCMSLQMEGLFILVTRYRHFVCVIGLAISDMPLICVIIRNGKECPLKTSAWNSERLSFQVLYVLIV